LANHNSNLTEKLHQKGIRASYHRVRILEYLYQCHSHPTVEDIFAELSPEIPTLSKATVYNTLHTFIDAGLVREINIAVNAQHYDVMMEPHGHFKCTSCGKIFNFEVDINNAVVSGLQGFAVQKRDVYFSGLCPGCQSKSINN
jgi:Fe2+ or Zn2+ uptake regulation protein